MDLELKKAFSEVQARRIATTKEIRLIDLRCDVLNKSKQKIILTERGISDLTPDDRIYQSVGRMFVLTTVPQMRDELKAKEEKYSNLITQFTETKEFLLKNLKEQEDSLRELVQQKKEAA